MKYILLLSCIVVFSLSNAQAHDSVKTVVIPLTKTETQTVIGKIPLGEVDTKIDTGITETPREDLAVRCTETQLGRLEECGDDTTCIEKVNRMLEICDELPTEQEEYEKALGILEPCNGIIPLQQCSVLSPCTVGTATCVAGARCIPASEGALCDVGLFYNCFLKSYASLNILTSVTTCDCLCE